MINLLVPLSSRVSGGVTQFGGARFVVTCRLNPLEGDGQETFAVLVVVNRIFNVGAPGVWRAYRDQNPLVTE